MKSPHTTFAGDHPLGFSAQVSPDAINLHGQTFIHEMAREGNLLAAETLIQNNVNLNQHDVKGWTPLHEAAFHGHLPLVILLIEHGAKINVRTKNSGYTPLHMATMQNHKDIAEYLLRAESDPNRFRTASGKTALHLAAEHGLIELVGTLIQHRADLFAKTPEGQTACDLAHANAQSDTAAILDKLMEHYQYRFS